jgi:hypothetical protein
MFLIRDPVRGVHPPVLTDRWLDAALSGLAEPIVGLGGALSVESPPGGPAIISAVLPCA